MTDQQGGDHTSGAPLYLQVNLPQVQFHRYQALHPFCKLSYCMLRERPYGHQSQKTGFYALFPSLIDGGQAAP